MNQLAQLATFLDPAALALVIGGALAIAAIRSSRAEFSRAFAALSPLVAARPDADAQAARMAVGRVEAIAEAKGIVCVDRVATAGRFLREAVRRLSDARSAAGFERWACETIEARRQRHQGAIAIWWGMADAAPAMGMIGTVLGLVRMFAHMDDPASIGAPMATALIATLWGLIVANVVAGPIAARLERISAAELAWQQRTLDHFVALAQAELVATRPARSRSLAA